jgi:hypothetical protein
MACTAIKRENLSVNVSRAAEAAVAKRRQFWLRVVKRRLPPTDNNYFSIEEEQPED